MRRATIRDLPSSPAASFSKRAPSCRSLPVQEVPSAAAGGKRTACSTACVAPASAASKVITHGVEHTR